MIIIIIISDYFTETIINVCFCLFIDLSYAYHTSISIESTSKDLYIHN